MKNLKLTLILFACLNMAVAGNNIAENDLQFDVDKKLSYHNVACKEQLDGYSFVADSNVSACEAKILKEYVINANLQSAYKEFIAKYVSYKNVFKDTLPRQKISYEYDDPDIYNDTIVVTYEIINPNFAMISIGYENGVEYFGFRQVDSNLTLIEVRELGF